MKPAEFMVAKLGTQFKPEAHYVRVLQCCMQVVKMLRFNGTRVPQDYEVRFQLALWAFRHCRVYCPTAKVR
jgi:exonuclease-1